jgi:hypothetical protein
MRDFERAGQRWEPTLPMGATHLILSVCQALANCLAAAGGAALSLRQVSGEPLGSKPLVYQMRYQPV